MRYSNKRLKQVLQLYRSFQSASEQSIPSSSQADQLARNKYCFRAQLQPDSNIHAARWQKEDSGTDDDDYNPSGKSKKRGQAEKGGSKRKATNIGDEVRTRKQAKLDEGELSKKSTVRASTKEELGCKDSFITFKVESGKGRKLLESLARQFDSMTAKQDLGNLGSESALRHVSMDSMTFEHHRKQSETRKTYEDQFKAQTDEIDNVGGRRLRNGRKVPEIAVARIKQTMSSGAEEGRQDKNIGEWQTAITTPLKDSSPRFGLPSPASTPPKRANFGLQASQLFGMQSADDAITISSGGSPPPSPGPPLRRLPSPPPSPSLQWIDTNWAHPIDFQHIRQPGQTPCHFCDNVMYGVCGLGERKVLVEDTGTRNRCFEERSHGHVKDGNEATRMCIECSLDRIYISHCSTHRLQILPGLDPVKPRLDAVKLEMFRDQIQHGKKIKKSIHPICSLCPCFAAFRCCTRQYMTKQGGRQPEGSVVKGCGLFACEICADIIFKQRGQIHKRFFRKSVDRFAANNRVRDLRADFDFLFDGSLLARAYTAEGGP